MASMFCLFYLWNYFRKINMKNFEDMTIAELRGANEVEFRKVQMAKIYKIKKGEK